MGSRNDSPNLPCKASIGPANLLSHANFATPDRVVFAAATANEAPLATAGRITRTITSSRQLQFAVKVLF